jgi:hypothetical protein
MLPPPAGSPEPTTTHYTTDDDDMSYTSSVPEDFQHSHTQVSTPETQHSWPIEVEQYSEWTSHDAFNTISAPSSFTQVQQPQVSNATHSPHWDWTASPMSQPPIMHFPLPQAYFNIPDPATLPAYDIYGSAPAMLSPSPNPNPNPNRLPGNYARAPTSSPVSRAMDIAPHRDIQGMSHFMRYGAQHQPSFQY